jgi:hypothetical protein
LLHPFYPTDASGQLRPESTARTYDKAELLQAKEEDISGAYEKRENHKKPKHN